MDVQLLSIITLSLSWIASRFSLAVVSASIMLLLTHLLYRRYFHPLARIPGPPLAAVSSIWYAYHVRNGHMLRLGTRLHREYGPVVRVRPNELWFHSKDAFKIIYSRHDVDHILGPNSSFTRPHQRLSEIKFLPWFNLEWPDTLDLLAERDMKRYRLQRRLIGPIYHINNLKQYEPLIDSVIARVITQLRSMKGNQIDLEEWMHLITVECLGAISLSWSPGYLTEKSDGSSGKHAYRGWRRRSVFGLFPLAVLAESFSKTAGRLFSLLWQVTYHTPKQGFKPFFPAVQKKISRRIKLGVKSVPQHRDIMDDLVNLHLTRPEFNERYLRRMAITNFGAGHETMTSTLVSVIAMIGTHPDVQEDIYKAIGQHSWPLCYETASRMEFVQASIKEAQRLHPVIGMSLPRTVPKQGLRISGLYIPPGTVVGCNPVSLHRNSDIVGPDPDEYRPMRWLQSHSHRDLEHINLIFGGGPRTCPGRSLAEMIVSKVVFALVKHYQIKTSIRPENEILYYFMAMLTDTKALFIPRMAAKT